MTTYQVIDGQTKAVVGTFKTRAAARRRADRLDSEYGACRYFVQVV